MKAKSGATAQRECEQQQQQQQQIYSARLSIRFAASREIAHWLTMLIYIILMTRPPLRARASHKLLPAFHSIVDFMPSSCRMNLLDEAK